MKVFLLVGTELREVHCVQVRVVVDDDISATITDEGVILDQTDESGEVKKTSCHEWFDLIGN